MIGDVCLKEGVESKEPFNTHLPKADRQDKTQDDV
jgi:hypothetical protein